MPHLIIVFSFLASTLASMAAGECWYLQMPKNHADYLVRECTNSDSTHFNKAIEKIPSLVENGTIKEIEIFLRAQGSPIGKIPGKHYPAEKIKLEGAKWGRLNGKKWNQGNDYNCNQKDGRGQGRIYIRDTITPKGQMTWVISTSRMVGKTWTPTFVSTVDDETTHVLLERDRESSLERSIIKSRMHVAYDIPDVCALSMTWLLPTETFPARESVSYRAELWELRKHDDQWLPSGIGFSFGERAKKGQAVAPVRMDASVKAIGSRGESTDYSVFTNDFPRDEKTHQADFTYKVTKPDKTMAGNFTTGDQGKKGTFHLTLK